MARNDDEDFLRNGVSLLGAIRDFGWFTFMFTAVVGAPSLLSLFQSIFVRRRLLDAFQWIIDGYNDLASILDLLVGGPLLILTRFLSGLLNVELHLQDTWRPLFILSALIITSFMRMGIRDGGLSLSALAYGFALYLGALLGAVSAAMVPMNAGWIGQGIAGAAPVVSTSLTLGMLSLFGPRPVESRSIGFVARQMGSSLGLATIAGGFVFLVAALLSLVPGLPGAGILALGILIILVAGWALFGSLPENIEEGIQFGLTVYGGFALAVLIVCVDTAIKILT